MGGCEDFQGFPQNDLCITMTFFLMEGEESKNSHNTELFANHINIFLHSRGWLWPNAKLWWQIRLDMKGWASANKLFLPSQVTHKKILQFSDTFLFFFEHFDIIIVIFLSPNCCSSRGVGFRGTRFILKASLFSFPAWTQVTELLYSPFIRNTIKYLYSGRSVCSDEFPAE